MVPDAVDQANLANGEVPDGASGTYTITLISRIL
jgi:hypothetical protein